VVKRTKEALAAEAEGSQPHSSLVGLNDLSAKDVFEAAEQRDSLAERIVDETAFYLALGAANAMHVIDPDMVVFGGGMIAAGESFLRRIQRHIHSVAFPVPAAKTRIRYAELGSDAGFIGAAACARALIPSD
jgi:glucokinase